MSTGVSAEIRRSGRRRPGARRGLVVVRWIDHGLTATWADRRGRVETWAASGPVRDTEALAGALAEMRRDTGCAMWRAIVLLEQRFVLFHVQETPRVSGGLLDGVLERIVAENRFFDEPACWVRRPIPGSPQRPRWLMALVPGPVLEGIERACERNQFRLAGVHPVAATLVPHLARAAQKPEEVVLLVSHSGTSHSMMVGRSGGEIYFARSVSDSGGEADSRVEREITRTIHFSQQRCGANVTRVFAMGSDCHARLSIRETPDGLPLECLEEDDADPVLVCREELPFNFLRASSRVAVRARARVAIALITLLALSILFAGVRAVEFSRQRSMLRWLEIEAASAARRIEERHSAARRLHHLADAAIVIGEPEDRPVAPTIATHVARVLPPSLRLTRIDIERSADGWSLRLEGMSRTGGTRLVSALDALQRELAGGPFEVRINNAGQGSDLGILNRFRSRNGDNAAERSFFVEGRIP